MPYDINFSLNASPEIYLEHVTKIPRETDELIYGEHGFRMVAVNVSGVVFVHNHTFLYQEDGERVLEKAKARGYLNDEHWKTGDTIMC